MRDRQGMNANQKERDEAQGELIGRCDNVGDAVEGACVMVETIEIVEDKERWIWIESA